MDACVAEDWLLVRSRCARPKWAAYVMVLLSPYPYPVFTRALCYLAYWPAVLAQSSGASPRELDVLILDTLAWALIGFTIHRLFRKLYRHGTHPSNQPMKP